MSQDYRIEIQKEDAFMKKYKPMTLEVQVTYIVELQPHEYAEYQDGKAINHFDHWDDSGSEPKIINEYPTE